MLCNYNSRCINTGHRKDAIFTGLRTAAELPTLYLNATTYAGFACFREDAGLFLSVVGVTIGRPKKSTAGFFWIRPMLSHLHEMRKNGNIADLFHDVHICSGDFTSFPRWLARGGGRHQRSIAILLRWTIFVCIFGLS